MILKFAFKHFKACLYAVAALALLVAFRGCWQQYLPESPPTLAPVQEPPVVPVTPPGGTAGGDVAKSGTLIDSRLVGKWTNRYGSWHSIQFDADGMVKEVQWFGTTNGKFRYVERGSIEIETPGIFEPNVQKVPYRIDGDILTLSNGVYSMRKTK